MNKDQKKQFAQLENVRFKQEQAVNRRVDRSLILSYYGLIDPKELPEECKKCSNFYCTFCSKCTYFTKKDTDYDHYVPNEQYTDNYKAYEQLCAAILREYTEVNLPSLEGDWVVRSEEPL